MSEDTTKLPVNVEKGRMKPVENAWGPLDSLRQEIDRLFDDFHPFAWPRGVGRALRRMETEFPVAPAVEITEKDGRYAITAELPGMEEKDIEVKVAEGILTIKGEKSEERKEEKKDYHFSERRYGSFQRSFRLPDGIDTDKIEASLSKGVLSILMPKSPEAVKREKKIDIKAG